MFFLTFRARYVDSGQEPGAKILTFANGERKVTYQKIGFITSGGGGNANGIGDYVRHCDRNGVPAVVFCNDGDVGIADAIECWDRGSTVPHVLAARVVGDATERFSVPNYSLSPSVAAGEFWGLLEPRFHPTVRANRSRVWVQIGNELDKNRSEWLADFYWDICARAYGDGYNPIAFNWSTGEPEMSHWRGERMLAFLRWAARLNVGGRRIAIGLHEYSLTVPDLFAGYPYMLGRFSQLFDVCDEYGIARPPVLFTEFGWAKHDVPDPETALPMLERAARLYEPFREIVGAGIWYLGNYQNSGIDNKTQRLIAPVAEMSAFWDPAEPEPEPEPGGVDYAFMGAEHLGGEPRRVYYCRVGDWSNVRVVTEPGAGASEFQKWIWRRSIEEQQLSLNPDAAIQRAVFRDGFVPVSSERWGTGPSDAPPDPLAGFKIAEPFRGSFRLTSKFNDPRTYNGKPAKHEGIDYAHSDPRADVLAGVAGVVVNPPVFLTGYGIQRTIKAEHNGRAVLVLYGHLDRAYVEVGQRVAVGQPIGEMGDTGNSFGEHVHLTLSVPGAGLSGYVFPDVVDPLPFMVPQPAAAGIDMGQFFRVSPDAGFRGYGDIVILRNNWGDPDERQQIQVADAIGFPGSGYWLITKNTNWELRQIDSERIRLRADTSPEPGLYYVNSGDWLPRRMKVGETFTRSESYEFRRKSDCGFVRRNSWTTQIRFVEFRESYVTNNGAGVEFRNVAVLEWLINGRQIELYVYAAGVGLIEWRNKDGRHSYAAERIGWADQAPNEPEQIPCLALLP